ncbi:MAG: NFACT RNA binding domain-containing protein [Pyrinomonadaceae bacterium]
MNSSSIEIIANELSTELAGRRFGKVFQLGRNEFAFDFRLTNSRYLYIDLRPADPAVYLIARRLRDLVKASGNPTPFALALRKQVAQAEIASVRKLPRERVIELELSGEDDLGSPFARQIIVQLTGKSANLFLTGPTAVVLDRARDTLGDGQQIGDTYSPPVRSTARFGENRSTDADEVIARSAVSPSEALDAFYAERSAEQNFQSLARSAIGKVSSEIRKREKLIANLHNDLAAHGNPDGWKRAGDLLLSNVSTAKRDGNTILVTDYFDEALPLIAVEADENDSVTEAAEKYFRRYTKARNAVVEVSRRIETLNAEVGKLQARKAKIELAVEERDTAFLQRALGEQRPMHSREKKKADAAGGAARRFISSDGMEILVGKRAKDNDVLTFKIAKSLDTWMHAADYPGSHVVVRNPNRGEIPQRTLHEAARLAAFYSQGRSQVKAAVHYTQKKFVNKPKGAAPGLVSLASFKTLLVEPGVPDGVKAD